MDNRQIGDTATTTGTPTQRLAPVLDNKNLNCSLNKEVFSFIAPEDRFEFRAPTYIFEEISDIYEDDLIQWHLQYMMCTTTNNYNVKIKTLSVPTNESSIYKTLIKASIDNQAPLAYIVDLASRASRIEGEKKIFVHLENGSNFPLFNNCPYTAIPFNTAKIPLLEEFKKGRPPKQIAGKKLYLQTPDSSIRYEWEILNWIFLAKDKNVFTLIKEATPPSIATD